MAISFRRSNWIVFAMSILQLASPALSTLGNTNSNLSKTDLPITPADYAFVIWGLITLLAFGYGIYQLLPNRKNARLHYVLARTLSCVYALFVCWIVTAEQNWLALTVIIFLAMFALLRAAFTKAIENRQSLTRIEKVLLLAQLAIYTGWSTVAVFVNIAAMLKFYGLNDNGISGTLWQVCILLAALANSCYHIIKFNRNIVYICTILWAFVGVLAGVLAYDNLRVLQVLTMAAIAAVLLLTFRADTYFQKRMG